MSLAVSLRLAVTGNLHDFRLKEDSNCFTLSKRILPIYPAPDLEGHDRIILQNAADRELVGRGQRHLPLIVGDDAVALTDGEGAEFAKLLEAMAQGVDLVPAGDRHQIV